MCRFAFSPVARLLSVLGLASFPACLPPLVPASAPPSPPPPPPAVDIRQRVSFGPDGQFMIPSGSAVTRKLSDENLIQGAEYKTPRGEVLSLAHYALKGEGCVNHVNERAKRAATGTLADARVLKHNVGEVYGRRALYLEATRDQAPAVVEYWICAQYRGVLLVRVVGSVATPGDADRKLAESVATSVQ